LVATDLASPGAIGGTTPAAGTFNPGITVTDGTDPQTISAIQEPGLGGRLTIGLDETARTMVICDEGDKASDLALATLGHPQLFLMSSNTATYLTASYSGISTLRGNGLIITGGASSTFRYADVLASGDAFIFEQANPAFELTDADNRQAMIKVAGEFNQTGTAAADMLNLDATTTSLGDGSTGDGNNFITMRDDTVLKAKIDLNGTAYFGPVGLYSATTTLTTAQVNALRATPIALVASQGANTIIELVSAVITYDYATAAFTVGGDEDLVIEYADGTDATASIETAGFLDQADDEVRFYPNVLAAGADLEASIAQGLQIFNTGTGETADGGGEVDVRVVYRVYQTGF